MNASGPANAARAVWRLLGTYVSLYIVALALFVHGAINPQVRGFGLWLRALEVGLALVLVWTATIIRNRKTAAGRSNAWYMGTHVPLYVTALALFVTGITSAQTHGFGLWLRVLDIAIAVVCVLVGANVQKRRSTLSAVSAGARTID